VTRRVAAALLVVLGCLAAPRTLRAEPQGHVALRTAFSGTGEHGALWEETRFCASLIGDLLFLRERESDFGVGPYLELTTAGFFDVRWGGGANVLVPAFEDFPFVIGLGAYGHELESVSPGATVFWGARSYNFSGAYNLSLGLFVGAYRDLDARGANLLVAGFELDGMLLALPFVLGWQAVR